MQSEHFLFHKQSARGAFDFPIVSAAMKVDAGKENLVKGISLCYSGVAAYTGMATNAMALLRGKSVLGSDI